MGKLINVLLLIVAIYLAARSIIGMFFYEQLPIPFIITEFNLDQINEYRARVLLPGFFITLIYFIFRFFSGKNPTSVMWPIYVSTISLVITHIIGFLVFLPFTKDTIIMFLLTLLICLIARIGHNKRKNEIF
tara:strand:- start:410 stop:805 length:396 start_codon:yes stop_codon:yes gene_type:complete